MKEFFESRIKELLPRHRAPAVVVKVPDLQSDAKVNNQEFQETLPKAANEVRMLYVGDLLGSLIPPQTAERAQSEKDSNQSWDKLAEELPMFGQNIKKLKNRLKAVEVTKEVYPLIRITPPYFRGVKDRMAQGFLGTILNSRTITHPGYVDYDVDESKEANLMAQEVGLQDGWASEQAKDITVEQLIGKILLGDLRITYQHKYILLERKNPAEPALVIHAATLDQLHSPELSMMVWRLGIPRDWFEKLLRKEFDKPKKPRSFTISTDTREEIEKIDQYIAKTPLGDVEVSDCNLYPPATRFKGSFHSEGFEIIYALEGEATLFFQNSTDPALVDKDQVKMHAGDLAIIPSPTASGWSFVGEGFKFRYISSPPWRPDLVLSVQ